MAKFIFIIFNVLCAFMIAIQTDEYNHQLMYQFKGLLFVAFAQCMVSAGAFALMIHEYLSSKD